MPKASTTPKRNNVKGTNRRRNGYELTSQRNMRPILLGAASATVITHIIAFLIAPHVLDYTPPQLPTHSVTDKNKRVVFKVKKEQPEPEKEQEEEQQELPPPPEETPDVDILDTELKELTMRPGDTNIFVKPAMADIQQTDLQQMAPPTNMQLDVQGGDAIPEPENIDSPDPAPMNANDTIINVDPATTDLAQNHEELDKNLKDSSDTGNVQMPANTRSLGELLGESNLGSGSGVARLGAELLFDFNQCTLKSSAYVSLNQLAALIQINPDTQFIIEGHSDSIGSATYNAFISLRRAAAVRQWLRDLGVPMDRVYIRACAAKSPIVSTKGSEEEQKLNRRVEIHMRNAQEPLPEGCLNNSFNIDLEKSTTALIEAKTPTPQTYTSASPISNPDLFADEDEADVVTEDAPPATTTPPQQ